MHFNISEMKYIFVSDTSTLTRWWTSSFTTSTIPTTCKLNRKCQTELYQTQNCLPNETL